MRHVVLRTLSAFALLGAAACAATPAMTAPPAASAAATPSAVSAASAPAAGPMFAKGPNLPPCSLVSRAEAESFMGDFVRDPQPLASMSGELACGYGPNTSGAAAELRVYGLGTWTLPALLDGKDLWLPFADLGDEAYYTSRQTEIYLLVRKGPWVVSVRGTIGIITASQMAEQALSRL